MSDTPATTTTSTDYLRDLIGYGAHPPHARWPGDAKIAVQFVLNYEEGGENCVLHGDPASEQFLSELIGAAAYSARHLSMESIYEYGSRVGVWRILHEFERRSGGCRTRVVTLARGRRGSRRLPRRPLPLPHA